MVIVAEKPDTLDDSRNQPRPIRQHVHCCHSTDSDVYIDSHGRAMLHLKNYLRSTMTNERMSGLALMHVHKLDAERIIHQFSRQKNRRLALLFSP